ncbi:MAG: LysE family transporter [Actinomycetota bacterium]
MNLGLAAGAFWLGVALGTSPGPVQVLLIAEAARGGAARGLRAMLGANATFGLFLLALAFGVSALEPSAGALRAVRVVGGAVLVTIAISAFRERRRGIEADPTVETRRPLVRGSLAVLLSPGVYLFLATTGAALVAGAARSGGRPLAIATAFALLVGVSATDALTVLLGVGSRWLPPRALRWFLDASAVALAAFGVTLVVAGLRG